MKFERSRYLRLAGVEINNRRDPILLGFIDTKYNLYTHLQLMCFGINKYMYKAFSLLHLYSSKVNSNCWLWCF